MDTPRRPGPWFRVHPPVAVAVAVLLYVAVFALRMAVSGTTEGISLLYVLPIALLALAFGAKAGWIAGGVGVGLLALWVVVSGTSLTPMGWIARVTPMLLLGGLVGAASDRLRDAAEAERKLLVAQLREREVAEINDAIVQGLAAAKWALEAGNTERGTDLVAQSIETAQAFVVDLLRGDHDPATVHAPGRPASSRR